jgi:hypothetical protein
MAKVPAFIPPSSILLIVALATSGCLTTRAADAKREPLVMPPAPPRVIAPTPEPPQEEPVAEPEPVPPLPRVSRTRENPRPESKPTTTSEPAPPPGPTEAESASRPPAPANSAPAPELRTVETPDDGKASQLVRDTLTRANRTLSTIDYRALPRPSQIQYDMAKRFIEQSEEAMKTRNYTAAQLMAEKAATIAKELSGR